MSYRSSFNAEEAREGNYFFRHWRGHLPLGVSYWLNGVLLAGVVSALALGAVTATETAGWSLQAIAAAYIVYLAFAAALWLWTMVGVWRSAEFHEDRGGKAIWAKVARFMVIVGLLGVLANSRNAALATVEYANLAVGRDSMGPPAAVTIEGDGTTLLVSGPLSLGTATKFTHAIEKNESVQRILLRSLGGRSLEAERMASLVASRGLDTEVKEKCESACTLVLLAGRERSAVYSAKVGFHQPTFPGMSPPDQQLATSRLRQLYEQAGVSADFLDRAMSVRPESMWYPSHAELIDANVLNTINVVVSKERWKQRRAQLARFLAYTAEEVNGAGPVKVDEITTRTQAVASDHELKLQYTVDMAREDVDVPVVIREMRPHLEDDSCQSRDMRQAIRAGAIVNYSYADRNGRHLFAISIDDCEEAWG